MKWAIWMIGTVLAALWSGMLTAVALVLDWSGSVLQQATPTVQQLPAHLPGWLAGWIEPVGWTAISQAIQQALEFVHSVLPAVGTTTSRLEPLVWIVWGLGMIALVTVAAGSHWLIGRRARAFGATK
jgi:hypothetical protein